MKRIIYIFIFIGLLFGLFGVSYFIVQASNATSIGEVRVGDLLKSESEPPPWFDARWHYRRPIVITNNGDSLSFYQVLIKLDSVNFDFSLAKADGSDVRFTLSDGLLELKYWIESWDSVEELAYIWVRVTPVGTGNTTIYIYYNNPDPALVPVSDGKAVFVYPTDFFDDCWEQFQVEGCAPGKQSGNSQSPDLVENTTDWKDVANPDLMSPVYWYNIGGIPAVISDTLYLVEGNGIRTTSSYRYKAVGYKANFGLGDGQPSGTKWGGFIGETPSPWTMIGDLAYPDHDDMYLRDFVIALDNNLLQRVDNLDWHGADHVFEVNWGDGQSWGYIDHVRATASDSNQVPSIYLPVTFFNEASSNAILSVDWVYIRQYRYPEPTSSVGTRQGLVELAISMVDSPDPLYVGEELTYELTITNASIIDSSSVVVTDTLPTGVLYAEGSPGCTPGGGMVICTLDTIPAQSSAIISIVVTPTIDGIITNLVSVGSQGYDPDPTNNSDNTITNVNPSANLSIDVVSSPEVQSPGELIAYIVTVSNQGPSDANAVSMVNTLPDNVTFINASLSSCDENALVVTCNLNILTPSQEVQIVITTSYEIFETAYLTDTATVSSVSTHDPDVNNNSRLTNTLVDYTKPYNIQWESPVGNEEFYFTHGGVITLQADAQDNDQLDYIKFMYFDEYPRQWVVIGNDHNPPYKVLFNANTLEYDFAFQFFAQAFDRVGNYDMKRIFIQRLYYNHYLSLINRK